MLLNLIPPAVKQEYHSSEQFNHWRNVATVAVVTVLIGTAGAIATWMMMERHSTAVAATLQKIQQTQATTNGQDITATTGQLNTTIKTLTTTLGTPRSWSSDTANILIGLPSTISIQSLTVQANGQFNLVGLADTRQSFVQLEGALKANPKLSKIATTSTASKRTSVPFDFSGTLVTQP